jgi:hypothetical protein
MSLRSQVGGVIGFVAEARAMAMKCWLVVSRLASRGLAARPITALQLWQSPGS